MIPQGLQSHQGPRLIYSEFHELADRAIDEIYGFTSNLRSMAKQKSRSSRATQIIKNLKAIISTYVPTKPTAEYSISSYAT